MKYNCKRCGYSTNIKCNLITHLERKKQCEPKLEDIDIETLKQELDCKSGKMYVPVVETVVPVVETVVEEKKPQYICTGCKKEFKNSKNLNQHMYRYRCKKKENEVAKKQDELAELKEKLAEKDEEIAKKNEYIEVRLAEMDFLKKQIEILMKKAGNNTTNTTNTDNSINDNSINDK